MNRLILLTMLLVLCFYKAETQPYYFRHYQVEAGLSNNTVNCSIQDKAGFLWLGTKEGLNRFDGYHFKLFNLDASNEQTLTPNFINCLFTDAKGALWAGAQKGLYRFDAESEQMVQVLDSLRDINNIQTDRTGKLWFTAGTAFCRYDPRTKKLKRFPFLSYFRVTSICPAEDGAMWLATADGLLKKWDPGTDSFATYDVFAHSPAAASRHIQKIYPASGGAIYIGTSGQGIKLFQTSISDYKDLITYNPDKTAIFVRDIVQYAAEEFWFATESGIFILNTKTGTFTNLKKKALDPYSLSDNAVYTLCKDREGGIWAGTYFGGVNYYPKQYTLFQKYFPDYTKNSISGSVVREICEDGNGNLWIGTEDAGLNKLNKKTGDITRFSPTGMRNSIAYSNIHGLLVTGNELWIGTFEHGLDVMDIRTGNVKKRYAAGPGAFDLKNNFIVCLLKTAGGEILAGSGDGLHQYNKEKDGFTRVDFLPEHLFISSLIEAQDKTIWIGTHNGGAFYFNPVTKQHGVFKNIPGNQNSLSNNTINAICEDSGGNLWFATEGGGLCRLSPDRKRFSRYTVKNGLPGNFVFKVLEDGRKKLWVSTSKGLVHLDPATGNTTIYTKANGLLSDQFNYNSGYKDAVGKLYFGSVKGLITFKPEDFLQRDFDPPVYITGFQVHNKELKLSEDSGVLKKSVLYTDKITLPHNRSSFSIDFAALSYAAPEMTTYSYRMKGLEQERTVIPSNHKVYFTNLAPGAYTFSVKAGVNGRWSKQEKQLVINILPPFWATAWAYLFYIIAGSVLFYYLMRSYHTHIEDKKEKEIYEAKIEFFTNVAHEIRTPLTLIKGPVENLREMTPEMPLIKDDVLMLERATNRLLKLITQILDFRKTETKSFSLDFSKVHISQLLHEEYLNFLPLAKKRALSFTINLPRAAVYALADEDALQKILSNLFSNAVKYADTKINIRLYPLKKEDTEFTVEIRSDGRTIPTELKERIFEPFYRLKEPVRQQGSGIGLALARSLAKLHKGRLYLKDTQDRFNTFVLQLPLKPEQAESVKPQKPLLKTT